MSKETDRKDVVARWFTEFWGKKVNLAVIDEIAAPDMLLKYSRHEPRRGRDDIKAYMTDFRAAFPDLNFWSTADLIAEGDYVVGQWEVGGTHRGSSIQGVFLWVRREFAIAANPPGKRRSHRRHATFSVRPPSGGERHSEEHVGSDWPLRPIQIPDEYTARATA